MIRVVVIQGGGAGAHDEDALLAASLREHLGDGYTVEFPRMPNEDEPDDEPWGAAIADAINGGTAPVVVVGHSIGGYLLVKQLAAEPADVEVAAVCLIAAPYPGGDPDWTFPGFDLPTDLAARLPDSAVLLYASEDDDVVPFAHRDLYATAIPGAQVRTTTGGHQLDNDLALVAADIRRIVEQRSA